MIVLQPGAQYRGNSKLQCCIKSIPSHLRAAIWVFVTIKWTSGSWWIYRETSFV